MNGHARQVKNSIVSGHLRSIEVFPYIFPILLTSNLYTNCKYQATSLKLRTVLSVLPKNRFKKTPSLSKLDTNFRLILLFVCAKGIPYKAAISPDFETDNYLRYLGHNVSPEASLMNLSFRLNSSNVCGIYELDPAGKIVYCGMHSNGRYFNNHSDLIGNNFFDIAGFENVEDFRSRVNGFLRTSNPTEDFSFVCKHPENISNVKVKFMRVSEWESEGRSEFVIVDIRAAKDSYSSS